MKRGVSDFIRDSASLIFVTILESPDTARQKEF